MRWKNVANLHKQCYGTTNDGEGGGNIVVALEKKAIREGIVGQRGNQIGFLSERRAMLASPHLGE